jgi:hypothetical protein
MAGIFTKYARKQVVGELMPWTPDVDMSNIGVTEEQKREGSPKAGDFICRNPKDYNDMWLITASFFHGNYDPVPLGPA